MKVLVIDEYGKEEIDVKQVLVNAIKGEAEELSRVAETIKWFGIRRMRRKLKSKGLRK